MWRESMYGSSSEDTDINGFSYIPYSSLARKYYNRWIPIYVCISCFKPDISNAVRLMRTDELITFEDKIQTVISVCQVNGLNVNSINDLCFYTWHNEYRNCIVYDEAKAGVSVAYLKREGLPYKVDILPIETALQLRKEFKIIIKGCYPSEDGTHFVNDSDYLY